MIKPDLNAPYDVKPTVGALVTRRNGDNVMAYLVLATSVLVVPLALLLFAQWPLREWVQT